MKLPYPVFAKCFVFNKRVSLDQIQPSSLLLSDSVPLVYYMWFTFYQISSFLINKF